MSIAWGLLWYDAEGTPEEKVRRAAERYTEKFGAVPDTCFVHPSEIDGGLIVDDKYRVVSHSTVLKNHLWIGEGK